MARGGFYGGATQCPIGAGVRARFGAYAARRMRRSGLIGMLAAALLALGGCGSSSSSSAGQSATRNATLVLDFTPNAVHAGIYEALARHDDVHAGVHLHIVIPSATTDSIKLLETGRVNFALLDIHDLAIARERGQDIVGVMAIVQQPLAAVIAAPRIANPRELDSSGAPVGITGVPSDTAVLHSIVAGAGGRPDDVKTITIGFNAVADLLAGKVAAATAFWNDEGVTVRAHDPDYHVFRVNRYGAPAYPELILCATGSSLAFEPRPGPLGRHRADARLPPGARRSAGRRACARVPGAGSRPAPRAVAAPRAAAGVRPARRPGRRA